MGRLRPSASGGSRPQPVHQESAAYRIISYLDDYWSPLMKRVHPLLKQPRNSKDPNAYVEIKELYLANATEPEIGTVRAAFSEFALRLGVTTGAAVELGKVLIELGKKQADIRDLAAGHELGYVIRAKEKL